MFKRIVAVCLLYNIAVFASAAAPAQSKPASNTQNYPRFTYLMVQPQMMAGFIPKSLIFKPNALIAIAAVKQVQGMPLVAIDATPSDIPQIKRALPQIEAAFREKLSAKFKKDGSDRHNGFLLTRAGEVEPIDGHFAVEVRYGGEPMVASTGPVNYPGEPESQTALNPAPELPKENALQFPQYPFFVGMHPDAEPPFPLNVPTAELEDVYKTFENVMCAFKLKFDKTFVDPQTKKPTIKTHGCLFMPSGEIIPTNYTELLLFGRATFTGQDVERVNKLKAQDHTVAAELQTAAAPVQQVAASPDLKALAEAAIVEKQRQERELKDLQDEYDTQEKTAQEYLKYDYLVIQNPLGGWKCAPTNAPKEEREKIGNCEFHIFTALNKKFVTKFGRELDTACRFEAQGDIQPMTLKMAKTSVDDKKMIRKGTKNMPLTASHLKAFTQKAIDLQQRLHDEAEAKKIEAARLQAKLEEQSKQRKAERNKKKRQRAKQKEAQAQIPVAPQPQSAAAPALSPEALLEKQRQEKELKYAHDKEAAANKKEAERLLAAQQALIKHKLAEKQKKGVLYAHMAREQADALGEELDQVNTQFVKVKKFGNEQEKTDLARKYQSIADRLIKLNDERSVQARAKYDELQKALKQKSKKK